MKSLTVIYGNLGDADCLQLANAWKGIDCAKVVEMNITKPYSQEEIDEAISQEEDTLLMIGHGSPLGLFAINGYGYAINGENCKLVKAKNVVCIWCYASDFCLSHNLKSLSSSMFVSNPLEAQFVCLQDADGGDIFEQDEVNEVDNRFHSVARPYALRQTARRLAPRAP